jgi:hypothetical protein
VEEREKKRAVVVSRCAQTEGGLEKRLANLWSRKKITKKAHAGGGQDTKWEKSIQYNRPKEKTHVN